MSSIAEFECAEARANEGEMTDLGHPDAVISLHPDPYAPRAARYCVSTVDRPSPDLRDVVVLLTSELVSRAVRLRPRDSHDLVELRVWVREDIARVELRGARELVCAPFELSGTPEDGLLLEGLQLVEALSDRWSIDADEHSACIWFELDRHEDTNALDAGSQSNDASGSAARAWSVISAR